MGLDKDQAFPSKSKYLGTGDVDGDLTVRISDVCMCDLQSQEGGTKSKPVIYFGHADKPLVLNRTNWDSIESLYGPNTDGWIGKQITLFVDPDIRYGDRQTGGIRIRPEKPHQSLQEALADGESSGISEDDIPF